VLGYSLNSCIGLIAIKKTIYYQLQELENAIEEMDGKTVRGPNRGPSFRIQA